MTKRVILTEAEMATFSPDPEVWRYLEVSSEGMGLSPGEMRVLDWGCGRGRTVAWLRARGFEAYGVDIDPAVVGRGVPLFEKRGLDASSLLHVLDDQGNTGFPNGYFHFVTSQQVFEHVKEISTLATELRRITIPGGVGFHVWGAHRTFLEGHLFMPLVHWLPKNGVRKLAIMMCVALGIEPRWPELAGKSLRAKAKTYHEYSVHKTYYRSWRKVREVFESQGFSVDFVTIQHPRVVRHRLIRAVTRVPALRWLVQWTLLTFKMVELVTARNHAG